VAHRFTRPARGSQRRKTLWLGGVPVPAFNTLASASSVLISSLNAAAKALLPFTVVRTVGWFSIRSDQQAAIEDFAGAFGQCIVTEQAVAIGVTAVPTPFTDNQSEAWFIQQIVQSSNVVDAGGSVISMALESKAMRKVEVGFDLVGVVENPLATGIVISTFTRILVKLH